MTSRRQYVPKTGTQQCVQPVPAWKEKELTSSTLVWYTSGNNKGEGLTDPSHTVGDNGREEGCPTNGKRFTTKQAAREAKVSFQAIHAAIVKWKSLAAEAILTDGRTISSAEWLAHPCPRPEVIRWYIDGADLARWMEARRNPEEDEEKAYIRRRGGATPRVVEALTG